MTSSERSPTNASDHAGAAAASDLRRAVESTAFGLALTMFGALLTSLAIGRLTPLSMAGCVGLSATALLLGRLEKPRSWSPTAITAVRAAITAWLAVVGLSLPAWAVASVVLGVFALDALDGHVARSTNSVSTLGGHLDGETDAMLTAVVCMLLFFRGSAGAWVLTSGFLRYLYVLATRFIPSYGLAPRTKFASRAFGFALVGLTLGFLPLGALARTTPALATLLLVWSFGRSFYYSFKAP